MITNYNEGDTSTVYECDICIVGSGAAALALLAKLYDTRYQVVVLEAGGEDITTQNQEIYNVTAPYHAFPGALEGRFRVFGGSTVKWGGQSLPLDPIDFVKRPWVPFSGWPISYHEVAKYYPEVDKFLQLEPLNYETDIYDLLQEKKLDGTDDLKFRFSKWSPKPNLREEYREKMVKSTNVTLIQNASLVAINLSENYREIRNLSVSNFSHKKGTVRAKRYVLACGGIENARLLLASNRQFNTAIGNEFDVVGRFLQDHPNASIGNVLNSNDEIQKYFNYFFVRKTRCLPRFILSEAFQKNHKVLNASGSVLFLPKENDTYAQVLNIYRKKVRGSLTLKDIQNLFRTRIKVSQLVKPAASFLLQNKVFTPNPSIRFNLMIEAPPEWANRVTLTEERDALGLSIASVEWQLNEQIKHTLLICSQLFQAYFPKLGLGDLQLEEWVNTDGWAGQLKDAYHHIGTTRMSSSAREGVVNTDCQVFGVENLYIAGSSIFPTSGHSNPTATLIALAFRLAEHLKTTLS